MKIFLAGSSAVRHTMVKPFAARLSEHGHSVFNWLDNPDYANPEFDRAANAQADFEAVRQADLLIWYWDSTPSEGAPAEFGYAMGIRIPVVCVVRDEKVLHNSKRIYPYHPGILLRGTEEEILTFILHEGWTDSKNRVYEQHGAALSRLAD